MIVLRASSAIMTKDFQWTLAILRVDTIDCLPEIPSILEFSFLDFWYVIQVGRDEILFNLCCLIHSVFFCPLLWWHPSNLCDYIRNDVADFFVSICRHCVKWRNLFRSCHGFRLLLKFGNYSTNTQHHSFPGFHWINTFANLYQALHGDRACQYSSSGGTTPASSFVCWQHPDQIWCQYLSCKSIDLQQTHHPLLLWGFPIFVQEPLFFPLTS